MKHLLSVIILTTALLTGHSKANNSVNNQWQHRYFNIEGHTVRLSYQVGKANPTYGLKSGQYAKNINVDVWGDLYYIQNIYFEVGMLLENEGLGKVETGDLKEDPTMIKRHMYKGLHKRYNRTLWIETDGEQHNQYFKLKIDGREHFFEVQL